MTDRSLYEVTGDIKDINTMLVSREEWNRRAQPAQAVPVLTDEEIQATYEKLCDTAGFSFSTMARAIEQAVLNKLKGK